MAGTARTETAFNATTACHPVRSVLPAVFLAALLIASSGCVDLFGLLRPDYHASVTPLAVGAEAWNRDGAFQVQVVEAGVPVHIEATDARGRTVQADGTSDATLQIPDGTWSVSFTLKGYAWGTYAPVRVDATPPELLGLQGVLLAPDGSTVVGEGATVVGATTVLVVDLDAGVVLGTGLPLPVSGLAPGLHIVRVSASDEAGNVANGTVQVRVGSVVDLPAGQYDLGVVARYNNGVRIWDIRNLDAYETPSEARAAVLADTGASYLAAGYGIAPDDADVQKVVKATVPAGATTGEAAMALYRWMYDTLEYTDDRLLATDLLTPAQTIAHGGGVCRDLAALYVSLLRGAGVPARIVTGYVAGGVNDFHAWVEFYGAPAGQPSRWVPVDVSPIDGTVRDEVLLSAFGIQLPEYLMLRQLPPSAEVAGWESAGSLSYRWVNGRPAPDVQFKEAVDPSRTQSGVLCVNPSTRQRSTASTGPASNLGKNCPSGTTFFEPDFTLSTERTIDYGVRVATASPGTTVTARIAYPFADPHGQDFVVYQFYGPDFRRDEAAGVMIGTLTR